MAPDAWPALPYDEWADTLETFHLWTQIVGKLKLALCPFRNHWWHVSLALTPRGLTSGTIPWQAESFRVDFDLIDDRLVVHTSSGAERSLALEPRSVADLYGKLMGTLHALGIDPVISAVPSEVDDPLPFAEDTTHAAYDGEYVRRWWRAALRIERALHAFGTQFHGKSSPVQLFWGGFDLSYTRFSGRRVATSAADGVIREYAEDEENVAVGFWPGSSAFPNALLYAYILPAPAGLADARVEPSEAHYVADLGEFVLLYEDIRTASSPDEAVARFLQSTYEASVGLAGWDRAALEGHVPPR